MIRTDELRGIIAKNGLSQSKVAEAIGISPKTFYEKMKNGVFGSNEIQIMINLLGIENPVEIFFANEVTDEVTKKLHYKK
ncbi:MAG TPA: DUF739 domain-containing protein [Clostridiales bacterium]|nr:DUF739 domain-containing protein [Clostridiales bacterium]